MGGRLDCERHLDKHEIRASWCMGNVDSCTRGLPA
jgi:hypothetical protein